MPAELSLYQVSSFLSAVALFSVAAFLGKVLRKHHDRHEIVADDVLKLVLGASLSLFGLLLGFMLSFAVSGHNNRIQAEENEAYAIGKAFQRVTLLAPQDQSQARDMLRQYMQLRIDFFSSADPAERENTDNASTELQNRMWLLLSAKVQQNPGPLQASMLDACDGLFAAQQKTQASWRAQIPTLAWALVLMFALCCNFLIGYNLHGLRGNNLLIMTFPVLIALSFFMIHQLDTPGGSFIEVRPDNLYILERLQAKT